MINEDFNIPKKEYEPLPEDKYNVELIDVELKEATGRFAEPGDKNFSFTFALLNGKDKKGEPLRGRRLWSMFVPTFFAVSARAKKWPGKNELYRVVESLTGKEANDEMVEKFQALHLNALIGKQCIVFTKNSPSSDGSTAYTNIVNYLPVAEGEAVESLNDTEKSSEKTPPIDISEVPFESEDKSNTLNDAKENLG